MLIETNKCHLSIFFFFFLWIYQSLSRIQLLFGSLNKNTHAHNNHNKYYMYSSKICSTHIHRYIYSNAITYFILLFVSKYILLFWWAPKSLTCAIKWNGTSNIYTLITHACSKKRAYAVLSHLVLKSRSILVQSELCQTMIFHRFESTLKLM